MNALSASLKAKAKWVVKNIASLKMQMVLSKYAAICPQGTHFLENL